MKAVQHTGLTCENGRGSLDDVNSQSLQLAGWRPSLSLCLTCESLAVASRPGVRVDVPWCALCLAVDFGARLARGIARRRAMQHRRPDSVRRGRRTVNLPAELTYTAVAQ